MSQVFGQILGFFTEATLHWWATIEGICAVVLIVEALVLLLTQRGSRSQRRWAALGPLVAAICAAVIAWGTWATERTYSFPGGLCHFAGSMCYAAVDALTRRVDFDIEVLGWVVIGMTVALALITVALASSNKKPATAPRPPK
jgi:peptidoglycan/LPS O-acetylase OafA/YrhL